MENKAKVENNFEKYVKIMDSLGVKQMVLQGPPGTSKTYTAKEIIKAYLSNSLECEILKKDSKDKWTGHWDMVQFHPSYGYEDFVRGITIKTSNNNTEYKTVNKIFGKMCDIANENKDKKFFLLIDEINRADIATVFGELIYALEYRNESVEVPYELEEGDNPSKILVPDNRSKISVPDNLYIIATMNTADKSVGNIDYAIRRRFLFFDLLPDENVIRKNRGLKKEENDIVINTFNGINKFIEDATKDSRYRANDFKIGHTYFLGCGEFKSLGKFIPYIDFIKKNKDKEQIKKEIIKIEYIEDLKKLEGLEKRDSIINTKNIVELYELREKLHESLNESLEKQKTFLYKMQYQVLPILREYYIDGIIKEQENYESFNKYLKGEDLNPISLIEIIKEFADNTNNNEESNV
ncbi:MAG: McrB family protein [Ruminococcus sp.]